MGGEERRGALSGRWRFIAHVAEGKNREEFANFILPTLTEPAEVWVRASKVRDRIHYDRVFIAAFDDGHKTVAVVREDPKHGRLTWTFYPADVIDRQRRGWLLYPPEEG